MYLLHLIVCLGCGCLSTNRMPPLKPLSSVKLQYNVGFIIDSMCSLVECFVTANIVPIKVNFGTLCSQLLVDSSILYGALWSTCITRVTTVLLIMLSLDFFVTRNMHLASKQRYKMKERTVSNKHQCLLFLTELQ